MHCQPRLDDIQFILNDVSNEHTGHLCHPAHEEFPQLAAHIVTNTHLNGEVIRLDGAPRMAPR